MPSKEYIRMIQLGEWLEKYMNPEIKTWEYRELAQEAVELYDIFMHQCPITPDYALPEMVQIIEKQPPDIQAFYRGGLAKDVYRMISIGEDPLSLYGQGALKQFFDPLHYTGSKSDDIDDHNKKRHIQKITKRALEVYWFQDVGKQLFKKIKTLARWEDVFLEEPLPDGRTGKDPFSEFLDPYSKLFQEFCVDPQLRIVKELNSINPEYVETKGRRGTVIYKSSLDFFPWPILVSRITLNFLAAGGQNYFLFCEQCGKFTVIRRQTRKKFCSNTCRTRHRRAQGN